MSPAVCRTCLTVLRENSHSFFTLENGMPGMTTFREKLNCCIPELALDIIPNAVICTTCSKTLNLAYDFKIKCLEVETKFRKYLQNLKESYSANHIIYSSQKKWIMDLKPGAVSKSQTSSSRYSEDLKQEQEECEDLQGEANEEYLGTCGDKVAKKNDIHYYANENAEYEDISVKPNNFTNNVSSLQNKAGTETFKIKAENDLNEESHTLNLASSSELIENSLNNETEAFQNYFAKTLQRLRDKNTNKSSSVYDYAREQFNLLKAVQTLTDQGTEININGLGISCKNKDLGENPELLPMKSLSDEEQTQNLLKQKKNFERYDCYYCNRSFDRLSLLKTHIISHTGVKPFTCNICGKGCSHKGELNNHMRTHTGEKPFKCSLCESSFSQISNMKIHMRTHTGEKPYKCDFCEKSFSHKCGVKVHMRTHTGERPYKCEICFKTYTHKKDLDDHMRTHTGEKYRCTICSKEITYKKNLSAHMITHSVKNGNRQGMVNKTNMMKYSPKLAYY